MEEDIINRRSERKKQQEAFEAQQRQKDEEERERIRQAKITLFDHSEFSPEIRYAITAIINLTSPYSPLVTLSQISYFKQFLGVSLNKSVNDLSLVD